jgi:hypothetical protein
MVSLRKFTTIEPKDIRYTLIPGETKRNYCKVMSNMRMFSQNNPFTLALLKKRIMLDARTRKEHYYKSGHVRPEREPLSEEDANSLISNMSQQGYLKYLKTVYPDKLHPMIPESGLKYYIFDQYKVIECQESKYFQSKIRKSTAESESKGKLSDKRCRALRQIYAQFGDKTPFTYSMVMSLPTFYKKIVEDPSTYKKITDGDLRPDVKQYYYQAAKYAESRDEHFLDTWNSLVRNNYIVPYEVMAKDGTRKIRQGAFKVNMTYARKCLSSATI